MVTSAEVPTSYTSRWNAGTGQPSARPPPANPLESSKQQQHPKYNSSCNSCRESRIKCSGGCPCRRCATLPGLPPCIYKISQRHGKRKASDIEAVRGHDDGSFGTKFPQANSTSPTDEANRKKDQPDLENAPQFHTGRWPASEDTSLSISTVS